MCMVTTGPGESQWLPWASVSSSDSRLLSNKRCMWMDDYQCLECRATIGPANFVMHLHQCSQCASPAPSCPPNAETCTIPDTPLLLQHFLAGDPSKKITSVIIQQKFSSANCQGERLAHSCTTVCLPCGSTWQSMSSRQSCCPFERLHCQVLNSE